MFRIYGNRYANCDSVKRRNFLEIGASLLGLSLTDMIRLRAHASEGNRKKSGKKSLIVFWTHGGMSQQDTYDMKPQAPAEFRGMYQPIATSVPCPNIRTA